MNMDSDTVSGWFILNSGFKVYGRCPACHSPRIAYHKTRVQGLKGISASSKGLTPACVDCGKSLPTQLNKESKTPQPKIVRLKAI
jgi:predicted Zn-ribbon and HTH transcriptional regulator